MSYSYTAAGRSEYLEDTLEGVLNDFMDKYGDTIGDYDELEDLLVSIAEHWAISSGYFE